ncbi:MAG: competence/damage-inducible protein A [Lachnospiraceae bacterium]|nr:competence/damage-inducible protein A [Lachnospiraceae bacterium]
MVVEIVCVGTEILLGNIVNTNAAYLSEKIAGLGLSCYYQTVVGDNPNRVEDAITTAINRSDIVILSGGLGPTQDDLTKEIAAKVCGKELILHEESLKDIEDFFKKKGINYTDNNVKQAMVPVDSIVLKNNNGTAPGIIIPYENKHVVLLPGPPNELKPMFEESVVPYFHKLTNCVITSQTVKVVSVGESLAETMIMDLIDNQTNPTIATYAKTGEVHIRVTASADSEEKARKLIKPVVKELKVRFGNNIYSTDENVTLEKSVVDLLAASDLKIMTVESCTGGMLASRLVNVPGASEVLKCGLVTYSNKAKRKLAGVKKTTIQKYTAVSAQTAREMAKGTDLGPKSDVIVSITGYAGPDSSEEEPAGLVYIACNVCGNITVKEFHFKGNRMKVRESATVNALVLVRQCILEYISQMTFGEKTE